MLVESLGVDTRPRWISAAIAGASALATLYAIELVFTVAPPAWVDRLGTTLRKGPSVVAETARLRQKGLSAYPYLQPDTFTDSLGGLLRLDGDTAIVPLAGIDDVLTVLCNESGTTITYRSDSLGFRNANDAWNIGQPTVALIGDSFAHGFCRPETETIAALLRSSRLTTVNAGITGAGPLAELGIVREYLTRVRPRLVYWLLYEGNDLIDISSERNTVLVHYLEPGFSQNLFVRRRRVSDAITRFADSAVSQYRPPGTLEKARAFITLRQLRTATGLYRGIDQPASRDENADIEMLRAVFVRARAEVEGWGGQLRIVYLPERRRFNSRTRPVAGENHDPRAVHQAVRKIADELNVPMLDAARAFAAENNPASLWNARRYHYNERGYAIVANLILRDAATAPGSPSGPATK